ncbi:hypothetical protein CsSME_00007465 [Camellia sinensis var. sinensis]
MSSIPLPLSLSLSLSLPPSFSYRFRHKPFFFIFLFLGAQTAPQISVHGDCYSDYANDERSHLFLGNRSCRNTKNLTISDLCLPVSNLTATSPQPDYLARFAQSSMSGSL